MSLGATCTARSRRLAAIAEKRLVGGQVVDVVEKAQFLEDLQRVDGGRVSKAFQPTGRVR